MKTLWLLMIASGATQMMEAATEPNAFLNLSARGFVDHGDNVLIGGLIVETRSTVLIRGIGPSLAEFDVHHPLPRPRLTLFDQTRQPITTNTAWQLAIPPWQGTVEGTPGSQPYGLAEAPVGLLRAIMSGIGAYDFGDHAESALYVELAPGLYTASLAADDDVPGGGDASATTVEIPWIPGGTADLQHGRAGEHDSRGWITAPRYTKTGADTAHVTILATVNATATVAREEIVLTFTGPGRGDFSYQWGTDDAADDRIAQILGQSGGTFTWLKAPSLAPATSAASGRFFRTFPRSYSDGRPGTDWALAVTDIGAVLQHGDGSDESDVNGAREAIVSAANGKFVMYYDGCGATGWRACQAISTDLIDWQKNRCGAGTRWRGRN